MPFLNFDAIKSKILDNSTIVVGKISDVFPPSNWGFHYDYHGEITPLQNQVLKDLEDRKKKANQDLQDRMVSNIGNSASTLTRTFSKNVNTAQVKNLKDAVVKNLTSDTSQAFATGVGLTVGLSGLHDKVSAATTEAKVEAELEAKIAPAKQEIRELKVENQAKTEVLVVLKKALDTSEGTIAILNQQLADSLARERDLKAKEKK